MTEVNAADEAIKLGKPKVSFGAHPHIEWKDKGADYA